MIDESVGSVTIRPASAADAAAISALVYEVVPELGYGSEDAVVKFLDKEYSSAEIRANILAGSQLWLIADHGYGRRSEPICGVVYLDPGARYFGGLHVRERRQGGWAGH